MNSPSAGIADRLSLPDVTVAWMGGTVFARSAEPSAARDKSIRDFVHSQSTPAFGRQGQNLKEADDVTRYKKDASGQHVKIPVIACFVRSDDL